MRYALFAFNNYYPQGGLKDVQAWFKDLEHYKSISADIDINYDVYQIIDLVGGYTETLHLYLEIQKLDDEVVLGWHQDERIRGEYIDEFVRNFIKEE